MSFSCKNIDCSAPDNKKGKIYPVTMECPFCDIPLTEVSTISEAHIELIKGLPYLIAYPLKRTFLEKDPLRKIHFFKDTFLNYLKYLGLIVGSEFFNNSIKSRKMVDLFYNTLTETTFGNWNRFIRETLSFLNERQYPYFCPDLNEYYYSIQIDKKCKLYKIEIETEDANGETKISYKKLTGIDSLINFRNRYLGHQQTLDNSTYEELWEQYFPIFEDLLKGMTFCSNYLMIKTEHGETYSLHSDEIQTIETSGLLDANVCIQDRQGNKLDLIPFIVVPGQLAIEKEDKEQMMVYESYTGKTVKFFSPEGTEKLTSGKILERLNLLLRDKQNEKLYNPETFNKEIFVDRIEDENKRILTTLESEKKVIPGVYVHRQDIEIKLREWIGSRSSIFIIAAEAGSGKTNLMVEMQKQYEERNLNTLFIRAGRMEKTQLVEQISYQLNLEIASGIESYSSLSGTQSNPTFFLIDGINESSNAESLWLEIFNLSRLFVPGSIKFVVTIRANSMVDITRYTISDEDLKLVYKDNNEFENGVHSYIFWLRNLNMVEMKLLWDNYSKKKDSIYIPRFSFEDIAYFDRKIYDQISNPLVMRIFLEVYNKKNLLKKGSRHVNLWEDWYNTFSNEEKTFLELLARKVWNIGKNELLLDDLLKSEELKYYLSSDSIKAPYQRLKNLGWVSRYIKDMSISIGFTVEGMLLYIIGNQLQKHTPKIDTVYINEELKKGNKLKISCLEAFLKVQAVNADMSLITALIDEGEDDLDISIAPLFQFMKIYGVDKTLQLLLEKVTDNDWKALIKLNDLLDKLQEQILRKEFLNKIIRYTPFQNQYDTELGLEAIKVIDNQSARLYFDKINYTLEFLHNDSELLSIIGDSCYRFAEYDKALEFYQKSLGIELKTIGEEHPSLADSHNRIGSIWYRKGEYDKALEYYLKSLNKRLKTFGDEHRSVASSYSRIGSIWELKGEYDKALEYYLKSLNIRLKTFGAEHSSVATSYNEIGSIWELKGEYDKALEYLTKCLVIELKTFGEEHPSLAKTYNNIGKVCDNKCEYEKALEYYQKSLRIGIKATGEEHDDTAATYGNIGLSYANKGEYEKGTKYLQKGLEIRLKTYGDEHPSLATSYNNIGLVFNNKCEYEKALEYYQKSLKIGIKAIGEEHDETVATYGNIGLSHANKGDYEKGMEYLQKGLEIRLKILDVNHPKVGILYRKIGKVFELKGEYENAVEQHQKCLEIRINNFGIDNILTKESISDIKSIYKLLGKEHDLQTWLEKLIEKK